MFGYLMPGLSATHKRPPATPLTGALKEEDPEEQGKAKENTPRKGREPSIGPSAGADQGHGKSPGLDLPHSDSTRGQHQRGQDGSGVHGVHGPAWRGTKFGKPSPRRSRSP